MNILEKFAVLYKYMYSKSHINEINIYIAIYTGTEINFYRQ